MAEDDPVAGLPPQIAQVSAVATSALQNLRRHDPEFKIPYSTSKLSGIQRVEDHLTHESPEKMIDVYGMSNEAFMRLLRELELQDSKYVAKEEKLAMFSRTVRNSASLRSIQDGSQRSRTTESECLKEVLSLLVHKDGFYGRYVKCRIRGHLALRNFIEKGTKSFGHGWGR